jgi:hypothetical protein
MIFHGPIQQAYRMGQAILIEGQDCKHVQNLIIEANDFDIFDSSAVLTKRNKFMASLYFQRRRRGEGFQH